jgi:hypothetical protein
VTALQEANRYARAQVSLGRRTSGRMRLLWNRVDSTAIASSWSALLETALAILGVGQATAARAAGSYVDAAAGVTEAEGSVRPLAFAGIASDGRPLESLLFQPAITALDQIKKGATPVRALSSGAFTLDLITRTQVADAGRTSVGTAIVARPEVTGWVRMLVGSSCSRCIQLAGRVYRWNQGFERHPGCNCRHIPYAESIPGDVRTNPRAYFDDLDQAEQDKIFTKAGAEAIRAGADISQVVNARQGMQTADGRLYTTVNARKRPRLMPEQIFRDAKNREDAIRLLKLHRYIT